MPCRGLRFSGEFLVVWKQGEIFVAMICISNLPIKMIIPHKDE